MAKKETAVGMLGNLTIGRKLLLAFLSVGIIPLLTVGLISMNKSSTALSEQTFNQLTLVREIKKSRIEQYFAERQGDMGVLLETVNAMKASGEQRLAIAQQLKKIPGGRLLFFDGRSVQGT